MLKVFETYTLERFNENFGTDVHGDMTLDRFTEELENKASITAYYVTHNFEDIEDVAMKEGYDLDRIFVYLIGNVFLATLYSI